jgi:Tol biopolymer transport system component
MVPPKASSLALFALAAGCGGEPTANGPARTGSLQITVSTTGRDPDLDGYTAAVDGGSPITLSAGGTVTIPNLAVGAHTVTLAGLQENCLPVTPAEVDVDVSDAATASAGFEVTCSRFWALAFNRPAGIQASNLAGTAHRVLVPGAAGGVWSPDGRSLAATSGTRVVLWNEDGTGVVELDDARERGEFAGVFDIVWAPDGQSLLYNSVNGPNSFATFLYRNFPEDRRLRAFPHGTRPLVSCGLGWAPGASASWSPDGSRIAVNGYEFLPVSDSGVYLLDAEGTTRGLVAPGGHEPEWSSDGSAVAFIRGKTGCGASRMGGAAIHLISPDGSNDRQLTFPGESRSDEAAAWSPDGSMIAFVRYEVANTTVTSAAIYLINADGTGERKVVDSGSPTLTTVSWSPDGAYLAFTDRGVRVVAIDGSDLHAVGDEETCCPAWRP